MDNISLLLFAKAISGHFSNKEQVQKYPNKFAHKNIYFRPIKCSAIKGPAFYSEQSYDHSPWSPYRQSLHKFCWDESTFIIENYKLQDQERFAGGGFNPNLLEEVNSKKAIKRYGCAMHFLKLKDGIYIGNIEPGKKCHIEKEKALTYVKSEVMLTAKSWTSEDMGFDIKTNKKVWGSKYGPLKFLKVSSFGNELNENWLNQTKSFN